MTPTHDTDAHRRTWDTYTQSWSETDPAKRFELFGQCLSPDCTYTDPHVQVTGYEQLSAYMAELHKNVPGVRFVATEFTTHHQRSLTHWNMTDGDSNVLSQGASFGMYGADGRLLQMTGFFPS